MAEIEKVMCYDRNDNTALLASLIGNRNSDAAFNQWNNPFMYLVWLSLSRNGGFGCEGNSSRLDEISTRLNTNQNTTLMMDAINGNHEALHALATNVGVSASQLQGAICGVQNAITQVAGQVMFSAEKVINAVLMGKPRGHCFKAIGNLRPTKPCEMPRQRFCNSKTTKRSSTNSEMDSPAVSDSATNREEVIYDYDHYNTTLYGNVTDTRVAV